LRERPELLETMQVYLREGMSARAAARVLFVHPNTVLYRLKIAQTVLGRPLTDVAGLADLILALRGAALAA
jgi:DNA-binding PucR family transcriptional regulator